jgi:hypothetical protein
MIAGFERPSGGHILLDGKDVTNSRPSDLNRLGVSRTRAWQLLQAELRQPEVDHRQLHEERRAADDFDVADREPAERRTSIGQPEGDEPPAASVTSVSCHVSTLLCRIG